MSKYRFEFSDKWWLREKQAGALESPEAFLEYDEYKTVIKPFFEVPEVQSFVENKEWQKLANEWNNGTFGTNHFGYKPNYSNADASLLVGFLKLLDIDIVPYLDSDWAADYLYDDDLVEIDDE